MGEYTEYPNFDKADARVSNNPKLKPYYDILIEYDWNIGDEHYEHIAVAPESELLEWCEMIRAQEEELGNNHA